MAEKVKEDKVKNRHKLENEGEGKNEGNDKIQVRSLCLALSKSNYHIQSLTSEKH